MAGDDGRVSEASGCRPSAHGAKATVSTLGTRLDVVDAASNDAIWAEFDAWRLQIDPGAKLDVYQLARLYARDSDGNPKGRDGTAPSRSDDSAGRQASPNTTEDQPS